MLRREFLLGSPGLLAAQAVRSPGFRLTDVTAKAGLRFTHNTGAFGRKYLPETMGAGCAFLDYDRDGWLDVLLVNGMDFPGRGKQRSTMRLYRNNRNGTFTDVTTDAGLDVEMYGMGVAVGDFDNDGWPDLFVTALGQCRLFRNNSKGGFVDVTQKAGLGGRQGFSTSAMWLDYDRDGHLDLFVCNYVRWSPESDVWCSFDGKRKAYCTPEAYRGSTCWLFRNKGDGSFEDVTAKAGILDTTSKSLGVALIDYDRDGWPDILVANDTQPNKLYRNDRDGRFSEVAVKAGLAFSEDGKARAGMGVDVADFDGNGFAGVAITNFHNEMLGLYRGTESGQFTDSAPRTSVGAETRRSLGFGCFFFDPDLDGRLDLLVTNGHIDETIESTRAGVTHAQPPHLFLNEEASGFRDIAPQLGREFMTPKVGRGAAHGDFDNDGDEDILITTNGGSPRLFRVDLANGNKSVRVELEGTKSNRDAIGAVVRFQAGDMKGTRTVKSGSSYLSESERAITIGIGRRPQIDLLAIDWPSGRTEEYRSLKSGSRQRIVEGKGISR